MADADNIAVLVIHVFIMSVVAITDYLTGIYRYDAYKISDTDMAIMKHYTGHHIVRILSHLYSQQLKVKEGIYDVVFTNRYTDFRDGTSHEYDIDGNQIDAKCRSISSSNIRSIVNIGLNRASISDRYTVCGSYEKRKGLYFKMALIMASNITVAIYTMALRTRIQSTAFGYPNVLTTVSIVLFVSIILLLLAIAWQLWNLKVCVTTQFLVENMSKLGIKLVAVAKGTTTACCWHALSVYVADTTLMYGEGHGDIYNELRINLNRLKVQCDALKNDMENTMQSISDSSYKTAGSNLTGTLVFFMTVDCARDARGERTLADSLIIASVGLFLTSAWYTLIVAGALMRYSSFLDKLKILTINVNFLTMCTKEATQENMLMIIIRQLRGCTMGKKSTRLLFERYVAKIGFKCSITGEGEQDEILSKYAYEVSELKGIKHEDIVGAVKCMSNMVTSDNFLLSKLLERDDFPVSMCKRYSETFSTCNKCFYYLMLRESGGLYDLSIYKIPYEKGLSKTLKGRLCALEEKKNDSTPDAPNNASQDNAEEVVHSDPAMNSGEQREE